MIQGHMSAMLRKENEKKKEWENMPILLTAAKNGILEMVEEMLGFAPAFIQELTRDGKNILLVAAVNKQPLIIRALQRIDVWKSLIRITDNENNNILHLAAMMPKHEAWHIAGSAMQMHWEVKWYQYLESLAPPHLIFQPNNNEDLPGDIFKESHKELMKDAGDWLKSTSESCSVVAALIAGVAYATASNVPGGNNDKTGKPTLEGQPVFDMFTIASLLALCFSVTALVMFLSILTSRQQPRYYKWDLPLKLLLGLSSLFLSIAAILTSFCSAYFFVLKDRMHHMEFVVIYAATCLPVTFYAVAQFPLYWEIVKAIFTNVPQPTHHARGRR
ncbi:hypothetical protein PIB30_044979 [Stylosanthes scabra]|uniref:PGG domain-containing protein n=1 Tax=Stylosanthes scabra TaxID=79078 RepID=A0ABU6VG07_9FABA|nr:hypothetical protein [Stylosanthes scabra]